MTKILAAICALAMLFSLMACGQGDNGNEITTSTPSSIDDGHETITGVMETGDSLYDENGYLKSNLPEDLDFGGETVTVLYWEDAEHVEFDVEAVNGDVVNDAIYERNLAIEELLHVDLAFDHTEGNSSHIGAFTQVVGNAYTAGETDYDLIASYSRTTATCAQNGYCLDMSDLPYLDFTNPWWPASLLDIVGIGDRIYFVSGDASINTLHMMYGTLYNKELLAQYNLTDPVELVRSGKWTIEALQKLSKDLYQDLDENGAKNNLDFYGATVGGHNLDAFYTGSGMLLAEQGEGDDLLVISDDYFSDKAISLCDDLGAWLATNDVFPSTENTPFLSGNCVFFVSRCRDASRIKDVDWSYGIVPVPKYDEEQENYITVVGNPFSLYAIYSNTKDADRAAAVLECWAAQSYRTTTPAQFETTMKLKYAESEVEAEMFDLIRSTVVFDVGRLFNMSLSDMTALYFNAIQSGSSWATLSKAHAKSIPRLMERINDSFLELQGD